MNIFTVDIGQGKVHVYDSQSDKFYEKLSHKDLINLNIPGLKRGDCVVTEDAHWRESHRLTLAQPFSFEQLSKLKENADKNGVCLKVYPQKSTPLARKLSGYTISKKEVKKFKNEYGISTDEADVRAISNYLRNDEKVFNSLKNFSPVRLKDYQKNNDSIFEYIHQSNEDINIAKSSEYGFSPQKYDYSDSVTEWIHKYKLRIVEYLGGDAELIAAIGLKMNKNGVKVDKPNRTYTLVHSILRPNGELRVRPDIGLVPNWKYIKGHYLGCKPYHMNQGVAASNYKYWMRPSVSEYHHPDKANAKCSDFVETINYEDLQKIKKARTKVDKMTQKIWYALRKMIVEDGLR